MNFPPESQALNPNEVDYLHMIQRFDQLWASARTDDEQAEMQRLLYLIEQYEIDKHDNRDSGISIAPENPEHRQGSFETPMRSTQ